MTLAQKGYITARCGMLGFVALHLLFKTLYVGSLAHRLDFAQIAIQHRRLRFHLKQAVIRVLFYETSSA